METITIQDFINLKTTIEYGSLIKVVILDQTFCGEFRSVYEDVRKLYKQGIITVETTLLFEQLDTTLLSQVISWLDELPGLLESCKLTYQEDKKTLARITELHDNLFTELEKLSVDLDNYLQGYTNISDITKSGRRFKLFKSIANAQHIYKTWFEAINSGDLDVIDLFIWQGQDVNIVDHRSGNYAITLASAKGYLEVVKILIEAGANPNLFTRYNDIPRRRRFYSDEDDYDDYNDDNDEHEEDEVTQTPLFFAIVNHHQEIAKFLLTHGASPTLNVGGTKPLDVAAEYGELEIFKLLVELGADINSPTGDGRSMLALAISAGNADIAKFIITHTHLPRNIINDALTAAVIAGDLETTMLLVDHGGDVNYKEEDDTLLKKAVHYGWTEIVEFLLNRGADPNIIGVEAPIFSSITAKDTDILKLLLEHGAKTKIVDKNQKITPLHFAIFHSKPEAIKLLLAYGADINFTSSHTPPPIFMIKNHHSNTSEVLKILIDHGADINAEDYNGLSLLFHLVGGGHFESARVVLEMGANVNIRNKNGNTPLALACQINNIRMIKLLLEFGADSNIPDNKGKKPVDKTSNSEIIKLLTDN